MLKLKFIRNRMTLDITKNIPETVIFNPREMIGILDLRLLDYYKIKQGVLQQNLSKTTILNLQTIYMTTIVIL